MIEKRVHGNDDEISDYAKNREADHKHEDGPRAQVFAFELDFVARVAVLHRLVTHISLLVSLLMHRSLLMRLYSCAGSRSLKVCGAFTASSGRDFRLLEEIRHPETAHASDDRKKDPAQVKRRMRRRLNMPINIDDAHEQEPGSEPNQSPRLALQLPREQQRERTAKWNTTRNRPPFPIRHSCGVYTTESLPASCRPR